MGKVRNKRLLLFAIIFVILIAVPTTVYGYNYKQYKNDFNKAIIHLNEEKYDDAISEFNNISKTYFGKKKIKEINNNIENAKEFKENKRVYDEALKLFNEKKYLEANEMFKKIPKQDIKRYDLAKKKMEECKNLYITLNIENAKNEGKANKYDSAINYLNLILSFDSANKDAIALKEEYTKAKQAEELKTKQAAEIKAKQEADAKKAEEIKNTTTSVSTDNNTPKDRPFRYMAPFVNRFEGKIKIKPFSMETIPQNYYDWNAKVEIIVHLKAGDKKFYGKVGEEIQLKFAPEDDALDPNGMAKYDLIVTDKYGVFKGGGTIYGLAPNIIPG